MTIDLRPLHRVALADADAVVGRLAPADLARATPCAGWTLADLLAHMIGQHRGFACAVRDGDAPKGAYTPEPFTAAGWTSSVRELLDAFAAADLDGAAVAAELAPVPIPVARIVGALLIDTAVHTWDLAQSLGHDYRPADEVVAACAAIARALPPGANGPGAAFAAARPLVGEAWADTLALVGRDYGWSDRNEA